MKKLSAEQVARMTPEVRLKYKQKLRKVRRNRRIVAVAVTVIAVAAIVAALSVTVLFNITEIKVPKPGKTYKAQEIISASGLNDGDNMIRTDFDSVCRRIEKNLPYIYEADISKSLNGTVTISIKENKPALIYEMKDGSFALADKDGKVLEIIKKVPAKNNYTVLKTQNEVTTSPGEKIGFVNEAESKLYNEILTASKAAKLTDITKIDISEPTDIYLEYQHRFVLHIGTAAQLEEKFKAAVGTIELEDKATPAGTGEINLTIPKKAYVKPLETTKKATTTKAKKQS